MQPPGHPGVCTAKFCSKAGEFAFYFFLKPSACVSVWFSTNKTFPFIIAYSNRNQGSNIDTFMPPSPHLTFSLH